MSVLALLLAVTPSPSPSPSPTLFDTPSATGIETAGAIIAIVFAIAAGVLGYRIIRGGRGL